MMSSFEGMIKNPYSFNYHKACYDGLDLDEENFNEIEKTTCVKTSDEVFLDYILGSFLIDENDKEKDISDEERYLVQQTSPKELKIEVPLEKKLKTKNGSPSTCLSSSASNPSLNQPPSSKGEDANAKQSSQSSSSSDSVDKSEGKLMAKKRGRTKGINSTRKKEHSKFGKDNMVRKIQVHYITFLVKFLNYKIKKCISKKHPLFTNLAYDFKKNISRNFLNNLKGKTIGNILQNRGSMKNKKQDEDNSDSNRKVFDSVYSKNPEIKKILDMNYLSFFQKVYAGTLFNNSDSGLKNLEVPNRLSSIQDLLDKEIDNDPVNGELYSEKLKEIVKKEFSLNLSLFKTTMKNEK